MNPKNPEIDNYLTVGCGRCPLGGTPECKVHDWQIELKRLREIVLDSGLTEELKWSVPCYTLNGSNVVIVSALKNHAVISFFKGALMADAHGMLEKPGENSQLARVIRFSSDRAIQDAEVALRDYLREAILVEESGVKPELNTRSEAALPEELERKLDALPALRSAWDKLTPGRRRGYLLHFAAAKQSKTRVARIEKHIPAILEGRGMHD